MDPIRFEIEPLGDESFRVGIYRDTHIVGEVLFFETQPGSHVWGERGDVIPEYRHQGLGTQALIIGDRHLRETCPGDMRVFINNSGLPANTYLNTIAPEQLVSYEGNEVKFYP